jgi:hypothetical protein
MPDAVSTPCSRSKLLWLLPYALNASTMKGPRIVSTGVYTSRQPDSLFSYIAMGQPRMRYTHNEFPQKICSTTAPPRLVTSRHGTCADQKAFVSNHRSNLANSGNFTSEVFQKPVSSHYTPLQGLSQLRKAKAGHLHASGRCSLSSSGSCQDRTVL